MKWILIIGIVLILLVAAIYIVPRRGVETPSHEQEARRQCKQRVGDIPPQEFTSDGCTLWPDAGIQQCCVEHDIAYWCGGDPSYRKVSDERIAQCVRRQYSLVPGSFVYAAVRIGGWRYWPFPWRWGYGRPYFEYTEI